MKPNITVRFATAEDAPLFAQWVADNPKVSYDDVLAVQKAKIPLTIVIEVDGKPEMFMPLIPAMTIGYLGFNPEQDVRTRAIVLREMHDALQNLQTKLGIQHAYVHTKAEYPMGKWAVKNGFKRPLKDTFALERKPDVL